MRFLDFLEKHGGGLMIAFMGALVLSIVLSIVVFIGVFSFMALTGRIS